MKQSSPQNLLCSSHRALVSLVLFGTHRANWCGTNIPQGTHFFSAVCANSPAREPGRAKAEAGRRPWATAPGTTTAACTLKVDLSCGLCLPCPFPADCVDAAASPSRVRFSTSKPWIRLSDVSFPRPASKHCESPDEVFSFMPRSPTSFEATPFECLVLLVIAFQTTSFAEPMSAIAGQIPSRLHTLACFDHRHPKRGSQDIDCFCLIPLSGSPPGTVISMLFCTEGSPPRTSPMPRTPSWTWAWPS